MKKEKSIKIIATNSNFEREPLIRPFGFKGGYLSEIWQTVALLKSGSGNISTGLCSQSVLWSDAEVFSRFSESGGNALMYAVSEYALSVLKGIQFTKPVNLLDDILDEVYNYAQKITGNSKLRKTFALNALVGVDNAAWLLYARENGLKTFDEMIPAEFRNVLSYRHKSVAGIPLMAYSIPVPEIKQAADEGYFFMKIKIGQPGTQEEMLEKDKARLTEIHRAIGNYSTEYTESGKLPYYFDANGRYQKKETLMKLLDHAGKIGALEQIALIEEPFPEESEIDGSAIPVRLAADESAHTDKDALARIQMGYGAIALKPIAKTLSMTLKIAQVAARENIPCFCADLTVNPILVDWNKNIAARLRPFPGLETGLLETNGHQNYRNWRKMESFHPFPDASWRKVKNGVFELDSTFYSQSGGVLTDSVHYSKLSGEL
jgi:L-alanine-DL-glutamate epimerase-like enolase superfamily enzyme